MTLITILLLASVTFGTRYLFLEGKLPIRLSNTFKQLLSFSGPAVLTAITMPILFIDEKQLNTDLSNPYLWGAVAATAAAYKTANIYWTMGLGISAFIATRFFAG